MRPINSLSSFLLGSIILTGIPTQLLADDNYYELTLSELLQLPVSSTSFMEEYYLQSSASVSRIKPEQWKRNGDRTVTDVISHLPGVTVLPSLAANAVSIRGYTQSTSVRGIATILSGVPVNNLAFGSALYDKLGIGLSTLSNIELVKGAVSPQYGSDAFHGVLYLQPYTSEIDESRLLINSSGSGYKQLGFNHSQQVKNDERLSFSLEQSEQPDQKAQYLYTDSTTTMIESGFRENAFRSRSANARYDLMLEQWKLSGEWYHNDHQASQFAGVGTLFGQGNPLADFDLADSQSQFDLWKISAETSYEEGPNTRLTAYYWESELEHQVYRPDPVLHRQITTDQESRLGFEAIYSWPKLFGHTDLSMSLSADRMKIHKKSTAGITDKGVIVATESAEPAQGKVRESYGYVIQAKTYIPESKWQLIYGARYDQFSDIGKHTSPRLGAIYNLDQNNSLKLFYGNAFRPPTAVEIEGIAVAEANTNLQPETIDTYEVILSSVYENYRSEFTLFNSKWKDSIALVQCPSCSSKAYQYQNTGDNRSYGIEALYAGYQGNWNFDLSASFIQSENLKTGQRYSAFPESIFNFGLGYQFHAYDLHLQLNNQVQLNRSSFPATEGTSSPDSLKEYWRADLLLEKRISPELSLNASIKNLFNRDNFIPSVWGSEGGIPEADMNITFGLEWTPQ